MFSQLKWIAQIFLKCVIHLYTTRFVLTYFQEIIGEEIVDEFDRFEDNHSKRAVRRRGNAEVMKGSVILRIASPLHVSYVQLDIGLSNMLSEKQTFDKLQRSPLF